MLGAPGFLPQGDALSSDFQLLSRLAVLIPAWNPQAQFVELVRDLSKRDFGAVVVVDDGSLPEHGSLFGQIAVLPHVEVLRHTVNLGKGRALKTGFEHLLVAHPDMLGVVTADADGQHAPADIERVARALLQDNATPVLGTRSFSREVPFRNRIGNRLTRQVFALVTGTRISDTQTGLRGLPQSLLPELLTLPGERYEYETTVLAHLCRTLKTPAEIPIATIYVENNRGSHFHFLWDSLSIYLVLLRLSMSSFSWRRKRV